jgi:hypothetical protein
MLLLLLLKLLRMVVGLESLRDMVLAILWLWLLLRLECEGRWVVAIAIWLIRVLIQRIRGQLIGAECEL